MDNLEKCYYLSASTKNDSGQAVAIDLRSDDTLLISASMHSYDWSYDSVDQIYGTKITSFIKDAKQLSLTIITPIEGSEKQILNTLTSITEKDIINKTPGKLYFGDMYLEGYMLQSETTPYDESSVKRVWTFFAPYPFWIYPSEHTCQGGGGTVGSDGLDYNYDYNYDFLFQQKGQYNLNLGHYAPSDFELLIQGPIDNPKVLVNGYPYEIFVSLASNEFAVINSKNHTVTKILATGETFSIFDLRAKEYSVFEKIPAGDSVVSWNGEFTFKLTVFIERSEPVWEV